jgi:hypothetical protein
VCKYSSEIWRFPSCASGLQNIMAGNLIHYERNIRSSTNPPSIPDTQTGTIFSVFESLALHYRGATFVFVLKARNELNVDVFFNEFLIEDCCLLGCSTV